MSANTKEILVYLKINLLEVVWYCLYLEALASKCVFGALRLSLG